MRIKTLALPALLATVVLGLGAVVAGPVSAATAPVNLGTATSFGVLAASTITNTGPTVIRGDLGLSPGTAVTGFPPGVVTGSQHVANAVALQAQSDTTTAYNSAAGRPSDATISADLAGQTLLPGVYSGPTLALNGTLTLDGANDPNAVFIFQSGSSLITGSNSSVVLVRGASACNVFWQVGSSATLGVGTSFQGTIAALTSITAQTGTQITGRLLARTAAVTTDTTSVTVPVCTQTVAPSPTASSAPAVTASPSAGPTASTAPTATAPASPSGTPAASASASASAAPSSSPTPAASASPGLTPSPAGPAPSAPTSPPGPTAPDAPVSNLPDVLTGVPLEGAPPADLTGGTTETSTSTSTSTSTQAGPFLPRTGGHAGQAAQVGLLTLLLGALLSLCGHRPRHALRR